MRAARAGVIEIVGLFLVLVGLVALVVAAGMVSPTLAVAVAGSFLVLAGILGVYVASVLDREPVEPGTRRGGVG